MGRGPKPAKSKEAKPSVARKSPKNDGAKVRDLEKRLAEALRNQAEALDQHTATSEILEVISRSPSDVQPVFEMIAENAAHLCDATDVAIFQIDLNVLRLVVHKGPIPSSTVGQTRPLVRETPTGRAVLDRCTIQVADVQAEIDEYPEGSDRARRLGYRTILAAPLLHMGEAIGAIVVRRTDVRPFTDRQVALLHTFANQAVIAIENVRLFNETQEALEQQTATSEILGVISSSPTDIQFVFDTIVRTAARLCDAFDANLVLADGDEFVQRAHHGPIGAPIQDARYPLRGTVSGRAISETRIIQVDDLAAATEYPLGSELAQRIGYRTTLIVPLVRDGLALGAIGIRRTEVKLFTDRQIALLKTFADQAVIAIENVRLFNETKEALERQTATSEILRVISQSPTDAQPVFDTIAQSAVRLCDAVFGAVFRLEGERIHLVAQTGIPPKGATLIREMFPISISLAADSTAARAIMERGAVHVLDTEAPQAPRMARQVGRAVGFRSQLTVPMLRGSEPIGAVSVSQREPGPFSEAQIELLKTFADQAVIAIQNVRLFKELQTTNRELTTALDQQTATSEILRVISQSPTDLRPVFDTIIRNAVQLCGATYGSAYRIDGDVIYLVAETNFSGAGWDRFRMTFPRPLREGGVIRDVVESRRLLYLENVDAYPFSEAARALFATNSTRSLLTVPMLRQDKVIGAFSLFHPDLSGFPDGRIDLVKTFADQAVIAIENVRLFTELQEKNRALTQAHAQVSESLEQQTATSEILRVIASSPTDAQPVFETIVRSAVILSGAMYGTVVRFDGDLMHLAAGYNYTPEVAQALHEAFPMRPSRRMMSGRAILALDVVEVEDALEDSDYAHGVAPAGGFRSMLAAPMLRDGRPIGAIVVNRGQPGRFSPTQIELLKTFADQAVIAIENVRLFTELQEKNQALTTAHAQVTESLEQQTATSEILRVISGSPTDTQPVFDAIARNAVALCGGIAALVLRYDGEMLHIAGHHEMSPDAVERVERAFPRHPGRDYPPGRALLERHVVHIPDLQAATEFTASTARQRGVGSMLVVPLLREGEAIGVISLARDIVGPFSAQQIDVLQTFADQAVIAIENVRLFKELQARTQQLTRSVEQLTALREVGHAVSSSLDLETVLNTIVARAVQLAGAHSGTIWEYDAAAEEFVLRITQNVEDPELRANRNARVRRGEGAVGRLAISQWPVQIPDITHEGAYEGRLRDSLVGAGTRALLAIPLLHEDQLLGGLVISRRTPGEFPAEVVELLASFATQSALALQNARLFLEIGDKSRQLEAASQHKSEFLANMSHELRTPLNAIIGFSEVLSEKMFGELNEKQEEYSKDIHASGQHLLSLINDILDLSKIEAGRMELELSDFHLPTALDSALTLVRERAGRRSIALQLSVDERLGQIRADERKVRQVVLNLLSNAIKFTPEGGRIEVRATPQDGLVEVSVSDTGVGIAPEDQEAVFEEFRQVGTADKKVEGTGLGLTLCRKFVELHGGRIWVKSQLGAGSTFTFTIPVRRGE